MDPARSPQVDLTVAEGIVDDFLAANPAADGSLPGDALIPLLQRIQDAYGYLPAPLLARVSDRTRIPLSRMYGVATFYAQFALEPHGRHSVRCCRGTACHVRGGKKVIAAVKTMLALEDGETGADMEFSFETVACLGACALAPVTVVDSTYYGMMTPRKSEQIIKQLKGHAGESPA
jgi:NADH-quinone oxidoreductase subunit E